MTQLLRPFSYGHGGLGVAGFALVCALLLPWVAGFQRQSRSRARPDVPPHARSDVRAEAQHEGRYEDLVPWLWATICLGLLLELVLTGWYLFSPAYLDHVEASVASSVHAFVAGAPLYPASDSYTFGGLLYGPLLAEINSLGYVLFRDSFGAKVVGWLAGWIAIVLVVRLIRRQARGAASLLALIYALSFLLSFGADVIVARTDPLLLLFAAAALGVALRVKGTPGAAILGLLCGAALELKVHAPLYLLPSLYLWGSRQSAQLWRSQWPRWVGGFCVTAAVAVLLPFVPHNVSAPDYLRYLTSALHHGLSLDLFGRNCALMAGLWAPILLLIGSRSQLRQTSWQSRGFALTLGAAECLVLVIASKPGAGVHHFLPFLVAHAFLFQELYVQGVSASPTARGRGVLAAAAALLGMLTPTVQTYGHMLAFNLGLPEQIRQRDELVGYLGRFPRGMLGVANDESYELANFRPWVTGHGNAQTDYGAFMDLQLSGTTDAALQAAFARCAIPFVYVPRPGEPFTLRSYYNSRPLFSDGVRREFANHYSQVDSGTYFDVFGCGPAGPHSQLSAAGKSQTRVVSVPESVSAVPVR